MNYTSFINIYNIAVASINWKHSETPIHRLLGGGGAEKENGYGKTKDAGIHII
jgi:hypothetical protein